MACTTTKPRSAGFGSGRNGVQFEISIDKEDVQDTQFYEEWKPLLRAYPHGEMPLSQWAEKQVRVKGATQNEMNLEYATDLRATSLFIVASSM